MNTNSKTYVAAFAGLALIGLAACATPAAYGPKTDGSVTGYTDQQLASNRYRVTFSGNSVTPRATVEDYLLYRAAQVTLDSGFAGFAFDNRDTKAKTTYFSSFDDFPHWPGFRGGWYWHSWAFDNEVQTQATTRYEAYAEIVMLNADQLHADPHALDAKDVIAHLGPRVVPQTPK